ncbi:MAG: anaerobic sulfatase maturase, partial [Candidatus Aminicenantaceae bacterium]
QVFVKPVGSICNLDCHYCYYLKKEQLYLKGESFRMPDDILEEYIVQHIKAYPEEVIRFSWHGGEPTLLGLDYFRKIVKLQHKHQPSGQRIMNGMQTNGTLLDEDWCRFLADEGFAVGLSMDGPQEKHDRYRRTKDQKSTFEDTKRGYELLQHHGVNCDILCVVNAHNVQNPTEVYRFFKQIKALYVSFLPMVERQPKAESGVSPSTMSAEAWGDFLCTIFDEWVEQDVGSIKVQIFEEATRKAFDQEHSLCIFRTICGDIPVIEHNGDFYSCDHFVDVEHRLGNIKKTPLVELLESPAQRSFGQTKLDTLPRYCLECEVRDMCNGECPKNRFIQTPEGDPGLNYLCAGYKRFFTHCQPFIQEVASRWHRQKFELEQQAPRKQTTPARTQNRTLIRTGPKIGRNDPCPCGSGMKYKKCCLDKDLS